jgi:hypothetical protein
VTATEPCPYCDGTGRRIVPPPPKPVGGTGKRGRNHGYEATYMDGCRCELCKAAHREGDKRRARARRRAEAGA